jgi:hypothetical protein
LNDKTLQEKGMCAPIDVDALLILKKECFILLSPHVHGITNPLCENLVERMEEQSHAMQFSQRDEI